MTFITCQILLGWPYQAGWDKRKQMATRFWKTNCRRENNMEMNLKEIGLNSRESW